MTGNEYVETEIKNPMPPTTTEKEVCSQVSTQVQKISYQNPDKNFLQIQTILKFL